ncbi:hypothetical protein Y695_01909 [Hydrogenophaga sp. T4]|nr:hypothetical protein Y695_01909 [Hydrogenophaga sp. T4]
MNQVKSSGFTKQMARNMFYGGRCFSSWCSPA